MTGLFDDPATSWTEEARTAVKGFGKAQVGDKTMIDAIVPFVDDLTDGIGAGRSLQEAWQHAAGVAEQAAQDTAQPAAKLGRVRSYGDKGIGTPDPGAVSFALVCTTVSEGLARAADAEGNY
jgi:D-erythrulose 4-kinase